MSIRDISTGLSVDDYELDSTYTRGEKLEELLISVCNALGEVGSLTENKADTEFLMFVVGTYLIAIKEGTLADEANPPSELFDSNLFPAIDSMEDIIVEEIEDEEDEG